MESEHSEFEKGRAHFDRREYFEAHEVWEEMWNLASGARHAFLQCLIQVAVALHHAGNRNFAGTHKLFATSLGYLERGRTDSAPVDLDELRERILDFENSVRRVENGETLELPYFALPYL